MLVGIGCALAAGFALWLTWLAARPSPRPLPAYGWWALGVLAGLEILLALRTPGVVIFFTALIWTAYVPLVDAAVYRHRGDSMLHHAGSFTAMALLSVPAWLIFEAYNLHLRNWAYAGMPRQFWIFALGATWAFATIFPGIFETADLVHCVWTRRMCCTPWRVQPRGMMIAGAVLLVVPLALPEGLAAYTFALVWVGFIFLLEPANRALGWPSLLEQLEAGRPGWTVALLWSGAACGFFWEFWNYWAQARWEYIFPILHRYRIFAMPVPGFIGFPPFALECFALYSFLAGFLLPQCLRAAPRWGEQARPAASRREEQAALRSALTPGEWRRRWWRIHERA
ncbi:MAG: hypothetical protein ACRD1C_03320 [Terriglobales bacterium]